MEEYTSLGAALNALMARAEINTSTLARRIGKSRYTIGRWRKDGARLTEEDIARLAKALQFVEGGKLRQLSEQEVLQLRIHGRCLTPDGPLHATDRSEPVDHCIVYAASYAPQAFPTRWSRRLIEVEQEINGNIYLVADYLASVTRPADFYERSFHREYYEGQRVAAYSREWQEYLDFFTNERLDDVVIQHIYERRGIQAFLEGQAEDWRDRTVPLDVRLQQLRTLLRWMEEDKIEVALTSRKVPACFKIVGHGTVMVEFTQGTSFLKRGNLMGLELRGTTAVQQFKDQFDSIWKSHETVRDQADVARELRRMLAALSAD